MFHSFSQALDSGRSDPRSNALVVCNTRLRAESNATFERTPPATQSAAPRSWRARAPQTRALALPRHSGVTLNSIIRRLTSAREF